MRRAYRIRVAADAAFGTAWFLFGVKQLGFGQPRRGYLEAVVGMRRDRRLQGGGRLLGLKRQGSRVYLWGLSFPVWVAWYRYPMPQGGWEWRYVVATRRHAPDPAHLGAASSLGEHLAEAVHHRALLPRREERVLPGAVRAADGFGGAPLSGALPSGLPAGPLGGGGGEGELAGGQGAGSTGSLS